MAYGISLTSFISRASPASGRDLTTERPLRAGTNMAAPHPAGEEAAEHVVVREAERERDREAKRRRSPSLSISTLSHSLPTS